MQGANMTGKWIKLAGTDDCPDNRTCPATWDRGESDYVYIVGDKSDADGIGLGDRVADHEAVVRIPRSMWEGRQSNQ